MRHVNKTIAGFAVLTLILAACGDDDDSTGAAATTQAPAATTAAPGTTAAAATTMAPATEAPGTTAAGGTEAPGTTAAAGGGDLDALYQECLDNGATVNLIALPDEWANYKGILASFGEKYPGVDHPVQNPNGSSQEELDAVVNLAGQPDMPAVVDVSPAKA